MRFLQSLSLAPMGDLVALTEAAASLGFSGVSVGDHLMTPSWPPANWPVVPDSTMPVAPWMSPDGDGEDSRHIGTTWPDPLVAVAGLAHVSDSLEFLVAVYVLPLRHPVLAAKAVTTVASMVGGRLTLGVGTGWMKEEYALVGEEFATRGARLDEQLQVIRGLMAGPTEAFEGRYYSIPAIEMLPRPAEPVPIYVGGSSGAALRRAAQADGWISTLEDSPEKLFHDIEKLRSHLGDRQLGGAGGYDIVVMLRTQPEVGAYRDLCSAGATTIISPTLYLSPTARHGGVEARITEMKRFADTYFAAL